MGIKEMVKDRVVKFQFYRSGELWYVTECGFEFPVPTDDVGNAVLKNEDKAIMFMRYIRKHLDCIEKAKKEN
jgi:hypothetical protein